MVWKDLELPPGARGTRTLRLLIRILSVQSLCVLAITIPAQAQQAFGHQAFADDLAAELRDPALAEKYHEAVRSCREGDCARAHESYRSIIAAYPNRLVAIQSYLAALSCCVGRGDRIGADALRKEFVEACEQVLNDRPDAEWSNTLCCLMASCAARIEDSDPTYQSKALEYMDKAIECSGLSCTEPSLLWQRAEVYALVYEKRGDWSAAIDTYEVIIPELVRPQSWYFKIRLANAVARQAAAIDSACGGDDGSGPPPSPIEAAQLRNRARKVLMTVVSEADESNPYGKLARQSLKDLENQEEKSQ